MQWVALFTPMPAKPIALVATLTICHNLQHHRLIWSHNQKYSGSAALAPSTARHSPAEASTEIDPARKTPCAPRGGKAASDARAKFGPAAFIGRQLIYYIAFGILFGIIYPGPRQYLGY